MTIKKAVKTSAEDAEGADAADGLPAVDSVNRPSEMTLLITRTRPQIPMKPTRPNQEAASKETGPIDREVSAVHSREAIVETSVAVAVEADATIGKLWGRLEKTSWRAMRRS